MRTFVSSAHPARPKRAAAPRRPPPFEAGAAGRGRCRAPPSPRASPRAAPSSRSMPLRRRSRHRARAHQGRIRRRRGPPRTLASRPGSASAQSRRSTCFRVVRLEHAAVVDLGTAHPPHPQRLRDPPALGTGADQDRHVRTGERITVDRGFAARGEVQQARDLVRGRPGDDPVRARPSYGACRRPRPAGARIRAVHHLPPPGTKRSGLPPDRAAATGRYSISGTTNGEGAANTAFTASTRAGTERQFSASVKCSAGSATGPAR